LEKTESFIEKFNNKNNLIATTYMLIAIFLFSISALLNKILIENNKSLGFDSINLVMGITMFLINIFLREKEIRTEFNSSSNSSKSNFSNKNINNNIDKSNNKSCVYFNRSFDTSENMIRNNDMFHNNGKIKNSERNFLNVFSEMKNELEKDFSSSCFFIVRCCLGTFADIFFFLSFKDLRLNTAVTLFAVYPIISAPISYIYLKAKDSKSSKSQIRDFFFGLLPFFRCFNHIT